MTDYSILRKNVPLAMTACAALMALATPSQADDDFPPFDKVSEGYRKVVSTADGAESMYTLYRNDEENQVLAELPRGFEGRRFFAAVSIAGGSYFTGWQWNEMYVYWRRINNQLVLMQPELQYQARGDTEIKSSVDRTYSDRVILAVPIVTMGPGGGPVIDMDSLLVGRSGEFALPLNPSLTVIKNCKAFPDNIELSFEGPGEDGRLTDIYYSLSNIPQTDYTPREADERIGYFLTVFKDFAKESDDGKQFVRYINRWNVKKRDPNLALSPPEKPIIFYLEHTVPVKYRRYVRDGILEWNKAFREIGIDGAIEVRQQDAKTGAYMDLDPEDVRYNFIRWITSEDAFAMGPSRANPETGEILDADIIFDDSMVRYYALDYQRMIAEIPKDDATPETLKWVKDHPNWDPAAILDRGNARESHSPSGLPQGDHEGAIFSSDDSNPGAMLARIVQKNRRCDMAIGQANQMNLARLAMSARMSPIGYSDKDLIDGLPEKFVAQVIKEIVTHEVGHTLGLRHNFKASAWKSLDQLNKDAGEPQVGSVMDYNPLNLAPDGTPQGDWVTPVIGPYDYWAIQYGYTADDSKLPEIASRVAEAGLQFATDEDAAGPDPLVRRFDLGSDPIAYGQRQIALVHKLRGELLDRAVKKGEAWYPARQYFNMLLYQQAGAVSMVSRFIGGTYVNRDRKGDPNERPPMVPVEAAKQREAFKFIAANAFRDEAFGLNTELLAYLATDKQSHWDNYSDSPEFPVHDVVMGVQRGVLLTLMNPTVLGRVYDNEYLVPEDQDAFTLPELLNGLTDEIWSEVLSSKSTSGKYTNRKPMISSLRRNLQREYITNLIDLSEANGFWGPPRAVQALAMEWMVNLRDRTDKVLKAGSAKDLDDYSRSHLEECNRRLTTAIDAVKTYTGN